MQKRNLILLPFLFVLISCISTGPRFQALEKPQSEQTKVYIYRQSNMFQQGSFVGVRLDGNLVATLKNGTYCALDLDDKAHEVEFSIDGNPICITCKGKGPTILKTNIASHPIGSTVFYKLRLYAPSSEFISSSTPIFLYSVAANLESIQESQAVQDLQDAYLAVEP
jgi:hypothetical protein